MARTDWANVTVVTHPVVQEKLTLVRDRHTGAEEFRRLLAQIARLLAFELTRDYPTTPCEVETPLGPCGGSVLAGERTLVPILRAGLCMAEGVLELLPSARVGHLGIYRDAETLKPVSYYNKLPPDIARSDVAVLDPLLATAGSLNEAIEVIRQAGGERISVLCLIAAPEGIEALNARHQDVPIYTAAIDERLDDRGYVIPGLGDAGDRLFGTA